MSWDPWTRSKYNKFLSIYQIFSVPLHKTERRVAKYIFQKQVANKQTKLFWYLE